MLGISLSGMKSRVQRGRAQLRHDAGGLLRDRGSTPGAESSPASLGRGRRTRTLRPARRVGAAHGGES